MRVGIISDTHDQVVRPQQAIKVLQSHRAEVLIHCGNIIGPEIIEVCSVMPFYFTFGNNDSDMVGILERTAKQCAVQCLGWGKEIILADKRIAVVHGHLTSDIRPLLKVQPNYMLSGHTHKAKDWMEGVTRRINPGAPHRAKEYSVALLDIELDKLHYFSN